MVWLGARARCFHNEVRCYLPTRYLKIEFGTFCQIIAAPPTGFWGGIRRQFRRGMFHIFAKMVHFGTPHLLDSQVAAWWLARLYACFLKVAPLAQAVELLPLVHCHHTRTMPLHLPPPLHARSLASSRQAKAWLAGLGMVWYGLVREPGAFIMKCGDTCRHNISKLKSGLSVKLLQLPLQGSREALGDNLEGACSIFLQKRLILVRHNFLDFHVAAWWLARLYACFRKVAPLALPVEIFPLVHCHHTPTLRLHPPPPPRARSLASSRQARAWLGLAWHGMVWLGAIARCFHNEVQFYLPTQYLKIEFGTFCQIIAAPPSGFWKVIGQQSRTGKKGSFWYATFIGFSGCYVVVG